MSKANHGGHSGGGSVVDPLAEQDKGNAAPLPLESTASESQGSGQTDADTLAMEIARVNDQMLRLRSDFDNFRRRARREQADLTERVQGEFVKDLLPVVDHFDLGLAAAKSNGATPPGVVSGFGMVYDQLCDFLRKMGVSPIQAAGAVFDPRLHECIAHIPADGHAEGVVTSETRRGYMLGATVLRPSQVVVSSGASAQPAAVAEAGAEPKQR